MITHTTEESKRDGYFSSLLDKTVLDPQNIEAVKAYRKKLIESDVYIYGAGNAGSLTYDELTSNGYSVEAFLDRKGSDERKRTDKHVYSPESKMISEESKKNSTVIAALLCSMDEYREIKRSLADNGFKDVRFYFPIHNSLDLTIHDNIDKMKEALKLLSDDKSREIFTEWVDYIVRGDKMEFEAEDGQYFPQLPVKPRYNRFIDCGAFTGDTYLDLKNRAGALEAYACFEADSKNFSKAVKTVIDNNIAKSHILLPVAVWNKTETLRFNDLGAGSGTVSDTGGVYVQAVSIDECLPDFAPTFIKMDIEGAEVNALKGAEKTIIRYLPDLAVCVYHRFSHLWECILYINSIADGYRFYMRRYDKTAQETVLYAVREDVK